MGKPILGKEKTNGLVQVKTGVGRPTLGKEKTNGVVQVKTGVGRPSKGRENKWISTGKNRGG